MEPDLLPTELILTNPHRPLGKVYLDWAPQPGTHVDFDGATYRVLERRHRYHFKANCYQLHKIALLVQTAPLPGEMSQVGDRQTLGDATCEYNAHSELLRCAVNPEGPCQGCQDYRQRASMGC